MLNGEILPVDSEIVEDDLEDFIVRLRMFRGELKSRLILLGKHT